MTTIYQQERYLEQRIRFFDKIFSKTSMVSGLILFITQVVSGFLGTFNYSILLTSFLAILLFFLGYKEIPGDWIRLAFSSLPKLLLKRLFFVLPILFTIVLVSTKIIVGNDFWKKMNTEGGLIEYGTSIGYILAFVFAIPIGKFFWGRKQKYLGLFYFFIALFFLFIGLEEISWGQRLIGLDSPEFFENYNSQDELTIHNLVWIKNYMDKACMMLGLVGGTSWILIKKIKHYTTKYIVPSWFVSSSFLIAFAFFAVSEYVKDTGLLIEYPDLKQSFLPFAESMELLLSLGCLSFVIVNFFRQVSNPHPNEFLVKKI